MYNGRPCFRKKGPVVGYQSSVNRDRVEKEEHMRLRDDVRDGLSTYTDNSHCASSHISDESDASQGAGGIDLVAVDDVLIARDEDAKNTEAEEDTRGQGGPDADIAVACPAHPEETDGDSPRAVHGEPEPKLGGEAVLTLLLCFAEFFLGLDADVWY